MLSQRIRQLRKMMHLSMSDFGKKLGCSRDVIANIEYERVEPKEVFLDHICDVFHVNQDWLYKGQGEPFTEVILYDDSQVMRAASIFASLNPELREWAMLQLENLQKLMHKKSTSPHKQEKNANAETIELLGALLKTDSMQDFEKKYRNQEELKDLQHILLDAIEKKQFSVRQAAEATLLPKSQLEALLKGNISVPRDALLSIAIGLQLDLDGTQRSLSLAQLPSLYVKNRRDSAIMFALMRKLSVLETNDLLLELEEPILQGMS